MRKSDPSINTTGSITNYNTTHRERARLEGSLLERVKGPGRL